MRASPHKKSAGFFSKKENVNIKAFFLSGVGLLRTSTSSPSSILIKSIVFVLIVIADILVFIHGLRACEQVSGIEIMSLRTGTRNLKLQDGEYVDVLRRSGLLSSSEKHHNCFPSLLTCMFETNTRI